MSVLHAPRLHAPRLHAPRASSDRLAAVSTMVLAGIAVVLTLVEAYDAGAIIAFAAVMVGAWSQLISKTRGERFETVISTVLAAVVLAACLAYGSGFAI